MKKVWKSKATKFLKSEVSNAKSALIISCSTILGALIGVLIGNQL